MVLREKQEGDITKNRVSLDVWKKIAIEEINLSLKIDFYGNRKLPSIDVEKGGRGGADKVYQVWDQQHFQGARYATRDVEDLKTLPWEMIKNFYTLKTIWKLPSIHGGKSGRGDANEVYNVWNQLHSQGVRYPTREVEDQTRLFWGDDKEFMYLERNFKCQFFFGKFIGKLNSIQIMR